MTCRTASSGILRTAAVLTFVVSACSSDNEVAVDSSPATTGEVAGDAPADPLPTPSEPPAVTADVSASATTAAPTTSVPTTVPTTETDDGVVRISINVVGGTPSRDDERVEVALGSTVELTVTADVADEVHVHGYDLFGDASPGTPVVVTFTADIPGLFEVELEDARLLLVELQVS